MSRSPSDINAKNVGLLTSDLGWSNGWLFRLLSGRPEIESRRGVIDFLWKYFYL